MQVVGWIEIYRDGEIVAECSPYYSLADWKTNEEDVHSYLATVQEQINIGKTQYEF